MGNIPNSLMYLLLSWGAVTAVLVALVAYRAVLSRTEDDSIYLDKAEEILMVGEQGVLLAKMNRLGRPIMVLAAFSGILLLACAGFWVWVGFKSF
jgi:hypothetical protein